ncbi:6-phospho-beta-glucosidase [Alkalibacterium gilvum]|uniref:6-phospho-beta-glucosidase n=1 Tax=Alkalibacterium gilvum TaxID=1130080 RepID=A0A1H6RXF0_9LACT|nr:6-phospho-beta-glucosidase [Alkalibacterium gilvum]SEI56215.1 6-phospho-beta-glucosidase [Alkalibacterium gilvum]
MNDLKVVVIGGGSSYTPELVEGFINRYDELEITELHLVDIESGKEKLNTIFNLSKRMIEKANVGIKIFQTLDRQKALEDADFIMTQIRVGGLDARVLDERIPLSHGIIGQETNGAGGMFKALRTIPVILDIVEDVKKYAKKDAWLINFTNPAGMVTEAVNRYSDFDRVVGLCNIPVNMKNQFGEIFDVDPETIELDIVGVNHHFFVTDILLEGKSSIKALLDMYASGELQNTPTMNNIESLQWSKSLIKSLEAIPNPYLNYYFMTKEQLKAEREQYEENNVRAEEVKNIEKELFQEYADPDLDVKPKALEERGGAYYSDAACSLVDSIVNNRHDIQYVNTLNKGTVSDFPYESVIETASIITSDGPKPLNYGQIPYKLNGTLQTIKTFERMVCEAAVKGDRDIAIAALTLNPLVDSDTVANDVFEELYQAHKTYLPQFD